MVPGVPEGPQPQVQQQTYLKRQCVCVCVWTVVSALPQSAHTHTHTLQHARLLLTDMHSWLLVKKGTRQGKLTPPPPRDGAQGLQTLAEINGLFQMFKFDFCVFSFVMKVKAAFWVSRRETCELPFDLAGDI